MRTVFCKEELVSANGVSSFNKDRFAVCEDLTTVFCYDKGEIFNDLRRGNIVFIMEQFIL